MHDIDALLAECTALRHDHAVLALGLSHDMRAPLRAIDSFAYLLEQRCAQDLDDTGRDHLQRIRDASARMGRLVTRLQAYLQVGGAPLHADDIDLTLLADWCIAELRDAHPQREAHVEIAPNLRAHADERLVKTAVAELVHNAWLYTPEDRPVRIGIDADTDALGTTLHVRDAGAGFDPARAARLGEPFQRLHADTHPDGSGLGLAIARRIAQRHGGTLRITGREGQGAVASLHLPHAPEAR
ncbi:Histidine kinase [Lysobacter dokdonensis DS-58]|uniref:histidine kinase n=1 Tax=Lysobacter dokdonensis DS-58 TaxID=1300345 RepID=A0A0A2WLP9_9GAMM|nr:ATP-binding protein [Lysobacter dokdonensis]KGQ19165.1 Histidine kinase [Lysobacter dokdonensis DS-58]